MKTTFLLLSPKILSFKNSITLKSFSKRLPFLLIGLIFWLGFYTGTYKVLDFIRSILFFGEILSKKLLSITFFSLGIFLILSNIITSLSSFYMSRDVPFLMSKPLKTKEILRLKTIETISGSSWMVISFIPPFFVAYGINYNATCLFYLVLILTFVPFLLITTGIGITIAHLLTRVFSIKKLRLYLLAIGLLLFVSIYLLFRPQWSISPESPENFFYSLLSIKTDSPVMPSFWITESVMPLLKRQSPDIRYPLLIFSVGVSMLFLSGIAGNRLYRNNIERILPTTKHGIKISTGGIYPGRNLALLWKDIKIFFRDAGQWSQLFIISALIFIYIYNFRTLPIKTISDIFPFMKELMVLINMLMAGLVLTAVSARFLYSSISLEGMAFWIIRTSPVTVKKLLWSKFLYGFIPVTVMLFTIVFITNMTMQIDTFLVVLSVATILILCISISGLGTGMGAIYPKFRYENVASISMNPGGMFFMLIAFLVVLLTISIEAWSFYLYKKAVLSGMEMSFIQKGYCIVAGFVIIFINGLAFYLPMRMGKKRLEEDLIL